MPLMKSSVTCQKARLPTTLASLNNDHNFNLCTCCVDVRSLSRPNFVFARPLCPHSAAWQSSFVANLSSTALGRMPAVEVEVRTIACHYHVAATTLARSFIWPYNSSVLNRCTSSFSISPSLASKPTTEVELALFLFGRISQDLHNSANHVAHIFGHHRGPLGFLCRSNLGCDSFGRLAFHQLVDRKVANGRERHNVLDGCLHLE